MIFPLIKLKIRLAKKHHKVHIKTTNVHLDNSAERVLANEVMVEGDTPLVPPKYHFLIVSTTFAFSTLIFESSFPSVEKAIWHNTQMQPRISQVL